MRTDSNGGDRPRYDSVSLASPVTLHRVRHPDDAPAPGEELLRGLAFRLRELGHKHILAHGVLALSPQATESNHETIPKEDA